MRPKIQSDSFWGDVANGLMLRPVYREPYVSPPEPEPKKPPVVLHKPHDCPKYDWEYVDGVRVPEDTLVACPDCGQWWIMINRNMRSLDFFERIQVRLYLKIKELGQKKP